MKWEEGRSEREREGETARQREIAGRSLRISCPLPLNIVQPPEKLLGRRPPGLALSGGETQSTKINAR